MKKQSYSHSKDLVKIGIAKYLVKIRVNGEMDNKMHSVNSAYSGFFVQLIPVILPITLTLHSTQYQFLFL